MRKAECDEKILEVFAGDLSRSSEHTRGDRLFYCRKFLDFAGDRPLSQWDKNLVEAFIEHLRVGGYAPSTRRTLYGIVKRTFDAAKAVHEQEKLNTIRSIDASSPSAGIEMQKVLIEPGPNWNLGKRSAPKLEGLVKPANTYEEIKAMVDMAKAGGLDAAQTAYLALSTVYGLRGRELCQVRKEHIDFAKRTIFVNTVKGGEKRDQFLCGELIPYIKACQFEKPLTPFGVYSLYRLICAKCGIEPKYNSGFHSIRRYLDTALVNLFGELWAHIFLRWALGSSSLMTERYYSESPLEVDRAILTGELPDFMARVPPRTQHPIVKLWGGG
jgi:integrase